MEIFISGYKVLIDDEDFNIINTFTLNAKKCNKDKQIYFLQVKYNGVKIKREYLLLHRYIMGCKNGDGKIVDHINGNTLDNRKCNLRICKFIENVRNRKINSNNTSGFKGVSWYKTTKKWHAQIKVDNRKINLGYFRCARRAYEAYCEASKKYHGDYGRIE